MRIDMNNIIQIRQSLRENSIYVRDEWIDQAIDYLRSLGPLSSNSSTLIDKLLNLFLDSDLNECYSEQGILSNFDLNNIDKHTKFPPNDISIILQIDEIFSTTQCREDRTQQKSINKRLLKLYLTDGYSNIVGIELTSIPGLDSISQPGIKIIVKGAYVRLGVLLLTPKCCKVLGGEVKRLVDIKNSNKSYENLIPQMNLNESSNYRNDDDNNMHISNSNKVNETITFKPLNQLNTNNLNSLNSRFDENNDKSLSFSKSVSNSLNRPIDEKEVPNLGDSSYRDDDNMDVSDTSFDNKNTSTNNIYEKYGKSAGVANSSNLIASISPIIRTSKNSPEDLVSPVYNDNDDNYYDDNNNNDPNIWEINGNDRSCDLNDNKISTEKHYNINLNDIIPLTSISNIIKQFQYNMNLQSNINTPTESICGRIKGFVLFIKKLKVKYNSITLNYEYDTQVIFSDSITSHHTYISSNLCEKYLCESPQDYYQKINSKKYSKYELKQIIQNTKMKFANFQGIFKINVLSDNLKGLITPGTNIKNTNESNDTDSDYKTNGLQLIIEDYWDNNIDELCYYYLQKD